LARHWTLLGLGALLITAALGLASHADIAAMGKPARKEQY